MNLNTIINECIYIFTFMNKSSTYLSININTLIYNFMYILIYECIQKNLLIY